MNLNLKPEVGQQLEAGTSIHVAKEWTVDLSAYRLDMKDEIDYAGPPTYLDENMEQTRRYGVDGALTWKRQDVGLAALSYNYVDAYFSAGANKDCTIPLVPAQVLTLRGELELPFDLTALSTVRAVGSQYLGEDFANEGPKIPGYATLDLGLRYHPHQIPGLDILFGVDNVFDHTYANAGYYGAPWVPNSYYPAAGRMWNLGATYRF
jgi:outer membrane receptor protein involved in Fe transport